MGGNGSNYNEDPSPDEPMTPDAPWDTPDIQRPANLYADSTYVGDPKKSYGWKNAVAGVATGLGAIFGSPTTAATGKYAASPQMHTPTYDANGYSRSSTKNTPSSNAGMGGNQAGSALAGAGLGYALLSGNNSKTSTQMYTDPVTGQLLPYLDAGLNERVANENLDNTIANQLRAQDDLNARRGMGMSTMQDANRASLGLSTAQTRNANRLTAQEIQAQRDLAAQTAAKQDALAQANLRYLQGVQDDKNRNAWISAAGDVAGSIDWDSLF